jgi:phosphomannomutase
MHIDCFKAYDVRGRVPEELDEGIAYRIGRAYAEFLNPSRVIIGRDARLTSESLSMALSEGLTDSGVDVYDIGLCGTEEVYFGVFYRKMDGGIMVTASHNPPDYNGMKFLRRGAKPVSGDSGLETIKALTIKDRFHYSKRKGKIYPLNLREDYIRHLLGYVEKDKIRPLRILTNPGNGSAGLIIDKIEEYLPLEFIKINHKPDGTFPNGIPNPLLPENRGSTSKAVIDNNALIGIAWDGDFDRCFFFDEKGNFIEGYYVVGLLASVLLSKHPGSKIIHDPRLIWNTIDIVTKSGGIPVMSKTGHAFIKERMRIEDALYGGEMSGHHYFKDFAYCDSGMIPWLLILEIISEGSPLSERVQERMNLFPISGEINRRVQEPEVVIRTVEERYRSESISIDYTDGLSMEFPEWRFNLRPSNTEPVLRLNLEARGNRNLVMEKTEEILSLIRDYEF